MQKEEQKEKKKEMEILETVMNVIASVVEHVNTFLWDYALLILLLGTGIIYSFSLKFIQVRKFGVGMKKMFGNFSLHGALHLKLYR